jgi:hypothetical protein
MTSYFTSDASIAIDGSVRWISCSSSSFLIGFNIGVSKISIPSNENPSGYPRLDVRMLRGISSTGFLSDSTL